MPSLFNRSSQKATRQKLRRNLPPAEQKLWNVLRNKNLEGTKFRRQFGIGPFIVDFYCPSAQLVIEIDGDSHYEAGAKEKDQERQLFIEKQGIQVIRFTNIEVNENLEEVVERIRKVIALKNLP